MHCTSIKANVTWPAADLSQYTIAMGWCDCYSENVGPAYVQRVLV